VCAADVYRSVCGCMVRANTCVLAGNYHLLQVNEANGGENVSNVVVVVVAVTSVT